MSRTLRSRKRVYPVEKSTVNDHHQDLGEANIKKTCVPWNQEGDTKCIKPLDSSSISDEKNGESETLEVNTADLKRQLVISLSKDCNQNKMEEEKIPNECETPDSSDDHIDVNAEIKPNGSGEQMGVEDNPNHKMETNQELDEIKPISIKPVVEVSAKKRRRMGMGRLSEKERGLFLPKCANKAESSEKQNENTVVVEEEKGSLVEASSPLQQMTEMMQRGNLKAESNQNKEDRGETNVETAATGMTIKCKPLTREMHTSEERKVCLSHLVTGSGCQMTVVAGICESSLTVCESENTKDSDQSIGNHHFAEEQLTRGIEVQVSTDVCKDHTEPDLKQASDQLQKTEHQQNQTETEVHLTVSICDALSPNPENYEPVQKPNSDKDQLLSRSETECHFTATLLVADSLCEPQNPELQTTKVQLDSHSEPHLTAELSNTNQKNTMIEQEPQKEIEVALTDKQHENKNADKDHSHSEGCNSKTNTTEEASIEQELHQPDTCDKMFLENVYQVIGENSHLIHTSVRDVVPETNCNSVDKGHMNSSCDEKEQHDTDTLTKSMVPPHSREYVSDSQLNTIDMTDQMIDVGTRVSPQCYEDFTDLVGGLIRELSSLNRMVMATHRELENLRRRGKTPRNTIR